MQDPVSAVFPKIHNRLTKILHSVGIEDLMISQLSTICYNFLINMSDKKGQIHRQYRYAMQAQEYKRIQESREVFVSLLSFYTAMRILHLLQQGWFAELFQGSKQT